MQENISPEERLLRLIRKDTKKSAKKEEPVAKGPAAKSINASSPISFALVNRILLSSLLILGIYSLVDSLTSRPEKIEERILKLGVEEVKGEAQEFTGKGVEKERLEPVTHYSEPVRARNLFTAASSRATGIKPTPTSMEMISKLRLQGIISGINPQAVIEDTKTKQVYFLSPGGYIGEIELKEILPGKVILNCHGQEMELSL